MSYESQMLNEFNMPARKEVENALLKTLFDNNGVIKEFGSGQEIVDAIADNFNLSNDQRQAFLQTIYKKENRVKRSLLWHRLLFRAADALAKDKLISKPTSTYALTNKKEWMLTEQGYDKALTLLDIPVSQKSFLPVKSYEVEKIVKKLNEKSRPVNYDPFDSSKTLKRITINQSIRARGFRQAIIEAYDYKCAFCGLKLQSPNKLMWEVEAAHIVPHSIRGKDDIWNGIALCRLHHWAFDVGWFTVSPDFDILSSDNLKSLPENYGKIFNHGIQSLIYSKIILPVNKAKYPHKDSLIWHQNNKFIY